MGYGHTPPEAAALPAAAHLLPPSAADIHRAPHQHAAGRASLQVGPATLRTAARRQRPHMRQSGCVRSCTPVSSSTSHTQQQDRLQPGTPAAAPQQTATVAKLVAMRVSQPGTSSTALRATQPLSGTQRAAAQAATGQAATHPERKHPLLPPVSVGLHETVWQSTCHPAAQRTLPVADGVALCNSQP
jgi:hypothetical protein